MRGVRTEHRTCKPWSQSARRPVWIFVRRSRSGRTDLGVCKIPPSSIEKLIPNQLVLALMARTLPCKTACHSFAKTKEVLRVGL